MILDILGCITIWLFIGIIVYEFANKLCYKLFKEEWMKFWKTYMPEKMDSITYFVNIINWPKKIAAIILLLHSIYEWIKSEENSKES